MRIIAVIVLLFEILKEANSLKCQYNDWGKHEEDPKEVTCEPDEEFCVYVEELSMPPNLDSPPMIHDGKFRRRCIGLKGYKGLDTKEGCIVWPSYKIRLADAPGYWQPPMTYCYCKQNNCNNNCTAGEKCTKKTVPDGTQDPLRCPDGLEYDECDSDCKPSGVDQVTNPAATETNVTTAEDKKEDSKATENPDDSTVEDKGEDSQATEAATEDGKGEDSKATEKSEGATGEPESGTDATKTSGCQRIANSFTFLKIVVIFIGIY